MEATLTKASQANTRSKALSTLSYMRALQGKLHAYEIRSTQGMQYDQQLKYVSWFFPPSFKTVEILHVTDTQFGHVECQVDRIEEYRDWVLSCPNRFVVLGGDMIDASTIFSPGTPWENICAPDGQLYRFCELFAPLRHRIIGSVGGNHERRAVKTFGDAGMLIASILQIPYSNGRQLIDIHFGNHRPFKVDLWHGRGAARTKGAKVMMLWNYAKEHPGADLYLCGHLHDCFILPFHSEERIARKNSLKIRKHYAGMSSSFLNTWGTYAEVTGMSITDVLMLRCVLEPSGRSEVTIR